MRLPERNAEIHASLATENVRVQTDCNQTMVDYNARMQNFQHPYEEPPVQPDQVMEDDPNFNQAWYQELRRRQENFFPALHFMIPAALPERDRERLARHFVLRGITVQDWTVAILKAFW